MRKIVTILILLSFSIYLSAQTYTVVTYAPDFLKPVKFETYLTFKGTQVNYLSGDSLSNLAWVRAYVAAHGPAASLFSISGNNISANSTSNNLLVGTTSNASSYKLYAVGGPTINGSVKSIVASGDVEANNFVTNSNTQSLYIGHNAGNPSANLSNNTIIGESAGAVAISSGNALYGQNSGNAITTGGYNSMYGVQSGLNNTTGQYNVYLGYDAGVASNGSNNTEIGTQAGIGPGAGSNNIFLGYLAGSGESGSNKLYVSNNATYPIIYGVMPNSYLKFGSTDSTSFYSHLYLRKVNPLIYFASNYIGMTATNDFKINISGDDAIRIVKGTTYNNVYLHGDNLYWNTNSLLSFTQNFAFA